MTGSACGARTAFSSPASRVRTKSSWRVNSSPGLGPPSCQGGSSTHRSCWPQTRRSMSIEPFPPPSRRQMLKRMCGGFGMVGLAGLLGPRSLLASARASGGTSNAPHFAPHFAPRAKRVIFLFLNGGPSHLDTFDPKPLLAKYEGQQPTGELFKKSEGSGFFPSPLRFDRCGQSGVEVRDRKSVV